MVAAVRGDMRSRTALAVDDEEDEVKLLEVVHFEPFGLVCGVTMGAPADAALIQY